MGKRVRHTHRRVTDSSSDETPRQEDISSAEAHRLNRLGLDPRSLPSGFQWSADDQVWTQTIAVDPSGERGMTETDAEQLALYVAAFNSHHGVQVLTVYFCDPDES